MELLNNIVVVPEYSSNSGLVRQVLSSLSEYIDDSVYSRRERDLKIIVFRPTGRPADEFGEAVLPLLKGFNGWVYLLVAFSGQYKNITDLVPDSEKSKVRCMEAIYIQSGQLLPEGSPNYSANKTAMEKTAIQIAQDYGLVMNRGKVQWLDSADDDPVLRSIKLLLAVVMFPIVWLYNFLMTAFRSRN